MCAKSLWLVSRFGWFVLCVWLSHSVNGKHNKQEGMRQKKVRLGIEGEGKVTKVTRVKIIECKLTIEIENRDRSWVFQVWRT